MRRCLTGRAPVRERLRSVRIVIEFGFRGFLESNRRPLLDRLRSGKAVMTSADAQRKHWR